MKNNSRTRNDSLAQSGRDYLRVAAALRRLAAGESADLSAAARDACLSPHHFQRMFRRWAGVSPQQFAACLTLAELKRRLATGDSILAAASAAGLSGVARAHDVFVAHDAATPGAFRRQGENMTIRFGRAQTPYGDATIAFTDRGVCALRFSPDPDGHSPKANGRSPKKPNGLSSETNKSPSETNGSRPGSVLQKTSPPDSVGAFAGDDSRFGDARSVAARDYPKAKIVRDDRAARNLARDIFENPPARSPLFARGTNFQINVWRALLAIPPGRVATYGGLARALGSPGAARAVGRAAGANPLAFLIPCHRVIGECGAMRGYAWGEDRKRLMLAREFSRSSTAAAVSSTTTTV